MSRTATTPLRLTIPLLLCAALSGSACQEDRSEGWPGGAVTTFDAQLTCPRAQLQAKGGKTSTPAIEPLDETHQVIVPGVLVAQVTGGGATASFSAGLRFFDPAPSDASFVGDIACVYRLAADRSSFIRTGCQAKVDGGLSGQAWVAYPVADGQTVQTDLVELHVAAPALSSAVARVVLQEPLGDGRACTDDVCLAGDGAHHVVRASGSSCSDGNACNGAETCDAAGDCRPGSRVPAGGSCSDGDACNGYETCDTVGSCQPGAACASCESGVCLLEVGDRCSRDTPEVECMGGTCGRLDHVCHVGCSCDDPNAGCEPIGSPPPVYDQWAVFRDNDLVRVLCGKEHAPCGSHSDCCSSWYCDKPAADSLGYCTWGTPTPHEVCE